MKALALLLLSTHYYAAIFQEGHRWIAREYDARTGTMVRQRIERSCSAAARDGRRWRVIEYTPTSCS